MLRCLTWHHATHMLLGGMARARSVMYILYVRVVVEQQSHHLHALKNKMAVWNEVTLYSIHPTNNRQTAEHGDDDDARNEKIFG